FVSRRNYRHLCMGIDAAWRDIWTICNPKAGPRDHWNGNDDGDWVQLDGCLDAMAQQSRQIAKPGTALLDRIAWSGDEQVVDVGWGRGLIMIGGAKRLTTGRATGIDIWQAQDLTRNGPEAVLENARRERVAERVDVQTADVRKLPFVDGSFDIVVSNAVIPNLYKASDRGQALREIARGLKPGGRALIEDIRHHRQYARTFSQNGCTDLRKVGSIIVYIFFMLITFGSLRPATLIARKS